MVFQRHLSVLVFYGDLHEKQHFVIMCVCVWIYEYYMIKTFYGQINFNVGLDDANGYCASQIILYLSRNIYCYRVKKGSIRWNQREHSLSLCHRTTHLTLLYICYVVSYIIHDTGKLQNSLHGRMHPHYIHIPWEFRIVGEPFASSVSERSRLAAIAHALFNPFKVVTIARAEWFIRFVRFRPRSPLI